MLERIARGAEDIAKLATSALSRVQSPIGERVRRAIAEMTPDEQRRVFLALASRPARQDDPVLLEVCSRALEDPNPRVRVAAARVLGKTRDGAVEDALAAALERASTDHERTALLRALSKSGGGERAAAALASIEGDDPALARARLIAERTALRKESPTEIALDVPLEAGTTVVLTCRRGLEPLVRDEIEERTDSAGAGTVRELQARLELPWTGTLDTFTQVRTALRFGLTFTTRRSPGEDEAAVVTRLLTSDAARRSLSGVSRGPIRYRLAWSDGAKRRAVTWQIAADVRARASELVNDPTESGWEVVATVGADEATLDLFPNVEDRRFAYRTVDIPASSHPTIAAALVRVGGVEASDVVWDPFCGSGLELCERALLGPYRALVGTDLEQRALQAAQTNLQGAGAKGFELRREDARRSRVTGLTSVITNPPMGRRVLPNADIEALLVDVVAQGGRMLEPGGRLVLLSPHPRATKRSAERIGLEKVLERRVDMGGFDATLQRFDKPRSSRGR